MTWVMCKVRPCWNSTHTFTDNYLVLQVMVIIKKKELLRPVEVLLATKEDSTQGWRDDPLGSLPGMSLPGPCTHSSDHSSLILIPGSFSECAHQPLPNPSLPSTLLISIRKHSTSCNHFVHFVCLLINLSH